MSTLSSKRRHQTQKWMLVAIGTVHLINIHALLHPCLHSRNEASRRTGCFSRHNLKPSDIADQSKRHLKGKPKNSTSKNSRTNVPWGADFITSRRTQTKIQSAAAKVNEYPHPVLCAQTILQTLLDTPKTHCNSANLVCALTLSAKTLFARQVRRVNSQTMDGFQQPFEEALGILFRLVNDDKLSPRQLCNAAWAVAKIVDYRKVAFGRSDGSSYSSTLVQEVDKDVAVEKRLKEVFNSIAMRMTQHLEKMRKKSSKDSDGKHVQTGEISMLLWAYATTQPRDLPPGWERPRRFEQTAPSIYKKSKNKNRQDHLITFLTVADGQLSGSNESSSRSKIENSDERKQLETATSKLFDAAAIAFSRGEGSAAIKTTEGHVSLLKACTWSELANVAWSFATYGAYGKQSDAMMTFLAREATQRLKFAARAPPVLTGGSKNKYCKILPRDAVQIAWAVAIMESGNVSNNGNALVHLIDAVNEYWITNESLESYRQLRRYRKVDLVQLALALGHGRLDNQSVLTSLYEEALNRLRTSLDNNQVCFSAPELSILLWVQAKLNLTPKHGSVFGEFPSSACQAILSRIRIPSNKNANDSSEVSLTMENIGLKSQERANLCWSLTILNQFDEHTTLLLQRIFHAASNQPNTQLEHAHQLWQAFFLLSDDCPDAVKSVPPRFSQYLERMWLAEKSRIKQSSYRHKAISKTLKLLGVKHQNEYKDVDIAIALGGTSSFTHMAIPISEVDRDQAQHKIAVEFDGPHHFTTMASTGEELVKIKNGTKVFPRILGHTALKYRMLKKKGWEVVRIPW